MSPSDERAPTRAAVTEVALETVRSSAPGSIEVVALETLVDLDGVDFLVPPSHPAPFCDHLVQADRLQVIQVLSAGTDWIEDRVPDHVTLCSARGTRDAPVAEWVLAALLGTSSHLLESARRPAWDRRQLDDLGSWTVVIVGLGSIGRLVAERLETLGTTVIGLSLIHI